MLVSTDAEKYVYIKPNGLLHHPIEVLPGFNPVYACVDCGTVKQTASFEVSMGETPDVIVLLSVVHKFPAKENNQF